MTDFNDKVVMVTGANGNVGSAVARQFAAQGASLALIARQRGDLASLTATLTVPTLADAADLGDPAEVKALLARVIDHFGRIDVLVHTVGGYEAGDAVHQADVAVLDRMYALNVRPVYITTGQVAAHMVEQGGGAINVILARTALKGQANHAAYSASKAAAQRIVESMALELRDQQVTVNGVLPSIIDTPQNREAMPNADTSKWVTPDDIAQAVIYLSGATKVTGASLEVYGRS